MKVNDLRIGNFVKSTFDGLICEILDIYAHQGADVYCSNKYGQDLLDVKYGIEPIELTEEVLTKIGFKKNQHNDWWEYYPSREDEVSILMRDKYTTIEYANLFHCPEDVTEVNYDSRLEFPRRIYLHQLQNAYYCLTGQELNIEL